MLESNGIKTDLENASKYLKYKFTCIYSESFNVQDFNEKMIC